MIDFRDQPSVDEALHLRVVRVDVVLRPGGAEHGQIDLGADLHVGGSCRWLYENDAVMTTSPPSTIGCETPGAIP
jgi:hypothetical protein